MQLETDLFLPKTDGKPATANGEEEEEDDAAAAAAAAGCCGEGMVVVVVLGDLTMPTSARRAKSLS